MEQKIMGTITFSCEQNKQSLLFGTTSMSIIYSQGHHSVSFIDPTVRRLTASLRHRSHMDDIPSDQQILICWVSLPIIYNRVTMGIIRLYWLIQQFEALLIMEISYYTHWQLSMFKQWKRIYFEKDSICFHSRT